jgi:hypothetical protein
MKKSLLFLPVLVLMQVTLLAQYAEGIKLLNYKKNKSAREFFQKMVDARPFLLPMRLNQLRCKLQLPKLCIRKD